MQNLNLMVIDCVKSANAMNEIIEKMKNCYNCKHINIKFNFGYCDLDYICCFQKCSRKNYVYEKDCWELKE